MPESSPLRTAGWIEPSFLARLARHGEVGWLVAGFTFLWIAAAEEAHFFGWVARQPTPEEAIELVGALCLGVYALELAARRMDAGRAMPVSTPLGSSRWRSTPARGEWGQVSPTRISRRSPAISRVSNGDSGPA